MAWRAASCAKYSGVRTFWNHRVHGVRRRRRGLAAGRRLYRARARRRSCASWAGDRIQHAVAGGDQDLAEVIGIDDLDLEDAGIVGAGGDIGALGQFDAFA